MREDWNKCGFLELERGEVEKLLRAAFPSAKVASCRPAVGGLANTNLIVDVVGQKRPVLLRLFVREPIAALKEYAIYSLLDGSVPVPQLHFFSRENPVNGYPYMVMEYVQAQTLDAAFVEGRDLKALGYSTGAVLASIHGHRFARSGFLDGGLQVCDQISLGGAGLIAYAEQCLSYESAVVRLGESLAAKLVRFLASYAGLLDSVVADGASLTHSDFGGSNILVSGDGRGWAVKAVIDWEFAFSGNVYFDFGNLLRAPRCGADFVTGVHAGYSSNAPKVLPPNWLSLARLADLFAWLEFLNRPQVNEALIDDIRRTVSSIMDQVELDS